MAGVAGPPLCKGVAMSRRRDRYGSLPAITIAGVLAVGIATTATAQDWPTLASFVGSNCFTTLWEGDIEAGARIVSSRQPLQITFGTGDTIFLEGPDATGLRPGDVHRIVRIEDEVGFVADDGSELGWVISFVGDVTVLSVDSERAMAQVGLACQGIELGDFVGPYVDADLPKATPLAPFDGRRLITPAEEDATVIFGAYDTLMGATVDAQRQDTAARQTYASGDVVTLDRGIDDGWAVGDGVLFYVAEAEEVYQIAGEVVTPPRLLGRGIVFWAQPQSASVMITDGDQPVSVGARARRFVTDGQ